MNVHAVTATDQLALADHLATEPAEQMAVFLAAAHVHALLEVAAAVREAGVMAIPMPLISP